MPFFWKNWAHLSAKTARKLCSEKESNVPSQVYQPTHQGGEFMIRKLFVAIAMAGLLSLGTPLSVHSVRAPSQSDPADKQERKATKSVSGKVTKIRNSGHSLSLQVAGQDKSTMEFVVDRNTQVNGQVREGTDVTVEYQAMESGQNLAVSITAQA
jgi:hypothetical protein